MKGARFSWLLAALALALLRCNTADPGAGSNTNWLRPCLEDDECRGGLSCLCGICTAPCDVACSELPDAICAPAGSASHAELCDEELGQLVEPLGLCLPACGPEAGCAAGQLCKDGGCLQLAGAAGADTGCSAVAQLELSAGGLELLPGGRVRALAVDVAGGLVSVGRELVGTRRAVRRWVREVERRRARRPARPR